MMGPQTTRTGDLICDPATSAAATRFLVSADEDEKGLLSFVALPQQSVVHAALEPRSSAAFRNLEAALQSMHREDPSFSVRFLQFEFIFDKIQHSFKSYCWFQLHCFV